MKKCPRCSKLSVDYDSYRHVSRCMMDGCGCVVIDDSTYTYIKQDPAAKTINRVKVEKGTEIGVVKKYSCI